jgi:hypothetical protein
MVSQVIRKTYGGQEILKIEEVTTEGTLSYFFTIENDSTKILLRVYHDGAMQKISEEKRYISKKQ